jgi:hypothetical protein
MAHPGPAFFAVVMLAMMVIFATGLGGPVYFPVLDCELTESSHWRGMIAGKPGMQKLLKVSIRFRIGRTNTGKDPDPSAAAGPG